MRIDLDIFRLLQLNILMYSNEASFEFYEEDRKVLLSSCSMLIVKLYFHQKTLNSMRSL